MRKPKSKRCPLSQTGLTTISYHDVELLREFLDPGTGQIVPRRKSGVLPRYQRELEVAIKRARYMALLPLAGPEPRADDDKHPPLLNRLLRLKARRAKR
jgi:small subunit ribosomal protein S18